MPMTPYATIRTVHPDGPPYGERAGLSVSTVTPSAGARI